MITDHSTRLTVAHGLDEDRLRRQTAYGADRAVRCDVPVERHHQHLPADALLEWLGNRSRNRDPPG